MLVQLAAATLLTQATEPADRYGPPVAEHHLVLGIPLGVFDGFSQRTNDIGDAYLTATLGIGLSLGYLFEAERFAAGVDVDGLVGGSLGPNGSPGVVAFAEAYALWYLSSGDWSPFLGGGMGYMYVGGGNGCKFSLAIFVACDGSSESLLGPPSAAENGGPSASGSGFLGTAEVGVQFGRWYPHRASYQLALRALLPFFLDEDLTYPAGLLLNVRFLFF